MSTFVSQLTYDLTQKVVPTTHSPSSPPGVQTITKQSLRSVFVDLNHPLSISAVRECLQTLLKLEHDEQMLSANADEEEETLRRAILGKLTVALYAQAVQTFLDEASDAETELEWWADIERSRRNVAYYLLQTFPLRLFNLTHTILSTVRNRGLPLHPSIFTPSSLRQLFPSSNVLRPNALTIALFPHLHFRPYSVGLTGVHLPSSSRSPRERVESAFNAFIASFSRLALYLSAVVTLPLELTRSECRYKRKELERIRDERAEVLGALADMRDMLGAALDARQNDEGVARLVQFTAMLQGLTEGERSTPEGTPTTGGMLDALTTLATCTLPSHASLHSAELNTGRLRRPSRLTLAWPRLVLLPPLALYLLRSAYASRASLEDMARDAWATARGFWEGWLLEPLREVVKTVRAGGDDGVIITRESVRADLDSLERMTLALAQEKLHYDLPQIEALSRQVQLGDLTAVMQIYEEDIKNPVKSAIQGTLLRSLFIQVQKAKVDINQALSGIDKLLKSQELTFAFVGVAPALAIVYAFAGYVRNLWAGGKGRGRYGGKKRRASVWVTMRRIERLLIAQPTSDHSHHPRSHASAAEKPLPLPPLTSGLLLLSVSHLRSYAEQYLPANSRIREGFLEDVADLEDPALGRAEKLRVLDRMWRSWEEALGWGRVSA